MTDWLPWGGVLMAGTFTTLGLVLRAVGRTPTGAVPDLRMARRVLAATVALTLAVYLLYLVWDEDWLWY